MEELTQIISQVGFPIAISIYLIYSVNRTNELHKAEIDGLKEAINSNTLTIQKLIDKLEGDKYEKDITAGL